MHDEIERTVRLGARALARTGLVHAYGHCSQRIDEQRFLVCASKPLGSILPGEPGTIVPIQGALPTNVLGEVRVHQKIYARRTDVGSICRIFPPTALMLSTLGITPAPRHGVGAFFAPAVPLWDDVRLLRDDGLADGVSHMLGAAPAIVLRGNGAVTVGATMAEATMFGVFLEEAARVEQGVRQLGGNIDDHRLDDAEIAARNSLAGRVVDRMWDYLTFGDPER